MLEATPGDAQFPRLAADASGAATAVWGQHDGTEMSIWANRYTAGQGWDTATLIEANAGDARGPWVAMDGNGNAVVVWSQYDGAYLSIWANRYVTGKGWGIPTLIETNPGDADFTRVAMDNSGQAIALWRQTDGLEVSIWASHFVNGDGWGVPTLLETNPGEASETWIAIDNNGNAMAVWRQTDGVDLSIWANRFVAGEGWGTPTLIEHRPGFASFPHVVFESNGNALVVWYQGPDSNSRSIWANHYTIGEGWGSPSLLENNPGNAQGPDVAIDASDRAIAVWRQFDGGDISIWANRYVPEEGWGNPTLIETNPGEAVRPAIAMDASGNAVVVWVQFDGTNDSVWGNRYVIDEGWQTPTVIEMHAGDARLPKVAMDSHEQALAVWSQDTGTEINIWANHELRTPTFIDVSEAAGFLRNNLQSSWGAAWGDYDSDGHVDVITLGHNQKETNSFSQLWHNNGDGTFADVTLDVGLDTRGDSHGAVWADYDNDGDLDVFIAKGTPKEHSSRNYNELWRNNNNGTFTNIAATAGVTGVNHRGRGVSAVDYDSDGDLDYFILSERDEPSQGGNLLYRNDSPTTFTDVGVVAGLAREGEDELFLNRTAAWADVNLDGFADVFLARPCALFLQKGDDTFVEATLTSGIGAIAECSSGAWGDYDNDGDLDLYITMDTDGIPSILYQNNGDETFTDVTGESKIRNPFSARAVKWGDYNNDGYVDLYIVNAKNQSKPNKLFKNNGDGTFSDVTTSAGVGAQVSGGGADATLIDYDNDGFLDIFITNGQGNNKGPYVLLKNTGNDNNWAKIKLIGNESNRDGIMTKVFIQTDELRQFQEYNGPSHYMSQDKTPLHFGLGQENKINRIRVTWPSRISQVFENILPNQVVTISEGESIVSGKPTFRAGVDLGYFIWKNTDGTWHIHSSGDGVDRHFDAIITTDGLFTGISSIKFEGHDGFNSSSQIITFQSITSSGQDGLQFKTTGTQVIFDLKIDGAYLPDAVHIGRHSILPASLPLTLKQ